VANGSETSDADFSWKEFATRINSELIGTFGNFINRVLAFINKNFPEGVEFPEKLDERSAEFIKLSEDSFALTSAAIEAGHFREALRVVFKLVEEGNRYINDMAPWVSIKIDKQKAASDLAVAAQVIKCLAILINPFLPQSSEKIYAQLGQNFSDIKWEKPEAGLLKVVSPEPIYKRIEDTQVVEQESLLGV